MKLSSYHDEKNCWLPIEVELELWPGLPEIHFLGRPDQHLKESAKRIKSAIKAQGFEFPVGQQILVNLRPSYLKKSSRGLELAVAAAYLMESGQVPRLLKDEKTFFYGELSLTGEVHAPQGLSRADAAADAQFVTGPSEEAIPFVTHEVRTLQDLKNPLRREPEEPKVLWAPDESVLDLSVNQNQARLLKAIALGRHSVLFAGQAGAGKTTFARILHALLPPPSRERQRQILRHTLRPRARMWRPFVQPHHSTPKISILGGSSQLHGGDLSLADGGLLLLDEFLEFNPQVLESLREPLEQKSMRVSRFGRVVDFPLRAQFLATTNLCPCGDFIPGGVKKSCRFTLAKCRSYSQRLSGPLLDRFEMSVFLSHQKSGEPLVKVQTLSEELQSLREKLKQKGRSPGDESLEQIQARCSPFLLKKDWVELRASQRRKSAALRLAQSFADLDGKEKVDLRQFQESLQYTWLNFEKLRRWDL